MWMVFVANHFNVVVGETVNIGDAGVEFELRQVHRLTGNLEVGLLKMVAGKVCITEGVNKCASLETTDLCHHVRKQCVGCNIEGDAEEHIGAALVLLAVEFAVRHMKLEECVAGHERHFIKFTNVPSRDDDSTAVGIVLDHVNGLFDLIDDPSVL